MVTETGRRRAMVGGMLAIAAILVGACATAATPELSLNIQAPPIAIPEPALVSVDGAQFEGILAGQRGTPLVVNIWASWCPPCRTEAPLLQRAAEDYAGRVTFLGIASGDRRGDAADFLERFSITYPNLFDDTGEVPTLLEMSGFPTTYVFDRDGELRAKVTGGISEQQLVALVDDTLRS